MDTRDDLPFFLNDRGLIGTGVEVGVQSGIFSEHILKNWTGKKLYLVDAWRQMIGYRDIANVDENSHLVNLAKTFKAIYPHGNRAVLIRESSLPASTLFTDRSLDFVYLDASHDYANVTQDLIHWTPKVKFGGIMCGHDYLDSPFEANGAADFGVKRAVNTYFNGVEVHVVREAYPSWWVQL